MRPHSVLGVSPDASQAEIKQAFRQLCMKWHPDLCPPAQRQEAERAFRNIAEAYATLSGRTPIRDWQSAAHGRSGAGTYTARLPKRYSNAVIALLISIPMVITGVFVGRKYPRLAEESWRPNGLFYPPVNPFLRESELPRQRARPAWGTGASASKKSDVEA